MRRVVLAILVSGLVSAAQAADLPDLSDLPILRGTMTDGLSTGQTNWDGFYVGGQVGYESSDMDFSNSAVSLTNFIFRNSVLQGPTSTWSVLNKQHVQGSSVGAFVGRNYQFDDVVFGFEANYNYMNRMVGSSASALSLAIVNPAGSSPPANHSYTYNTSIDAAAAAKIKDVVTLRGRAGWAAGDFMPYVFGGIAVGRMEVSRTTTTNVVLQDDYTTTTTIGGVTSTSTSTTYSPIPSISTTYGDQRSNSFVGGWTAGIGMEYKVWGGLFMRGEWEYVKFLSVKDTNITLNSVRAGLGYKF